MYTVSSIRRREAELNRDRCQAEYVAHPTQANQQRVVAAQEVLDQCTASVNNTVTSLARLGLFVGHLSHLKPRKP